MQGKKPFCQTCEKKLGEIIDEGCNHSDEMCLANLQRFIETLPEGNVTGIACDSDALLKIMNKCVQRGTDKRKVCHYVIESDEMSRMEPGEELHILTNELTNYDLTPMASLAIAINTQNDIHYYYYATADQLQNIKVLKEIIKQYYRKSFKARRSVTCWIRKAKSAMYDYADFLGALCGESISTIINRIVNISNVKDKDLSQNILNVIQSQYDKTGDYKLPPKADLKKVLSWIDGVSSGDEGPIYDFINSFKILVDAIEETINPNEDSQIRDFCEKIQLLVDMEELTIWQTRSDYEIKEERIKHLFEVFRYKDKTKTDEKFNQLISKPVETWLMPQKGEIHCGEIDCSGLEDDWVNNIHFLQLKEENPFTLCYNFTIFISKDDCAASWYTTYKNNDSKECDLIDNDLFMIDLKGRTDPLLNELCRAFKVLIESDESVKKELNRSRSKIIALLKDKG